MAPRTRGNGEGSVYQETKTGRWVAAVTVDGKRHRAIAKTQAEAKRKLRELNRKADTGVPIGDGALTLGQLLADWAAKNLVASNRSPSTITAYKWAVAVLTAQLGSKRLKALRPEHIEAAFARLAVEGDDNGRGPMSRASLIKIRSVLSQALGYAERRKLVSWNVARVVVLPAAARLPEPARTLTVDQAAELLQALEGHRLEALYLSMLTLGLRLGEASGLAWDGVDLDAGVVHVRQSLKVHDGQFVVTATLKTGRSRRSLDAPPMLVDALRRHRARQAAERLEAGPLWSNPDGLVFTTPTGGPLHPSTVRSSFRGITEGAGLGPWHPHELRHSAASLLSAAGVPLEEVADVLGHAGTSMTASVYRHATTPTVSASKRMGEILGAG